MLNKSFYICIKLFLTDDFAVLQFVKENNGKNCGFCVKKKDERKNRIVQVAKFYH